MAQHDYIISNGTGAAVRSDLNGALGATVSNNSGATEPATMYAYQWWPDTTAGLLKQRNSANSAWITIGTLGSANLGLLSLAGGTMTGVVAAAAGTAALPGIAFTGDLNTGVLSPGADQVAISTGGVARLTTSTTAVSSSLAIDHPLGAVGTPSITFTGDLNTGIFSPAADTLAFVEGGAEAARIDSSGRLLVGTSTAFGTASNNSFYSLIQIQGNSNASTSDGRLSIGTGLTTASVTSNTELGRIVFTDGSGADYAYVQGFADGTVGTGDYPSKLVFSTTADGGSSPTERMRIGSTGQIMIGTTTATNTLSVDIQNISSTSNNVYMRLKNTTLNEDVGIIINGNEAGTETEYKFGVLTLENSRFFTFNGPTGYKWATSSTVQMSLNSSGALAVTGALSKGSGSFKIDHPLPEKRDTHHLVHSFIEGPQADLIYRGKNTLVNGRVEINIDESSNMTEGTFVLLNREVQCFTSNETDWDAVRGTVLGNILTIECQNLTSTATVSWLVIGERQDQHMYETEWTDENGKVIVEPLKEIAPGPRP